MSEEYDKVYVDVYNFINNRFKKSKLDADDKIHVITQIYKNWSSILVDKKIEEIEAELFRKRTETKTLAYPNIMACGCYAPICTVNEHKKETKP